MADTLKDRGLEIFTLAGQSNMSGRGGMQFKEAADGYKYMMWDGVIPEECNAEPGSILRLTASLEWEEAHEPLHYDIDPGGSFSCSSKKPFLSIHLPFQIFMYSSWIYSTLYISLSF
jgi:hypothetical protein